MNESVQLAELWRNRGSRYFRGNLLWKHFGNALSCYNQSLLHPDQGEQSLALTYAERSAVSLECNEFKACLRNIQLAIDHNYPQNEIAVLVERKSECLKLMETNRENPWDFLKLTYPANNKVPFIVDCLELKANLKYGRHIITNRDLKVGDILAIEEPFTYAMDKYIYGWCATCCRRKLFDILPYNTSKFYDMFCSEACKELAMKTFHITELEMLSQLHDSMSMRTYMNALVLFGGSIEDLRDFLCANQSPSRTIFDCDFSSPDEIENNKNRLLAVFALIDDVDFTDKNIDQFASYFLKCAMKISKKYTQLSLDETFNGIYLFGSVFKHSLTPNCEVLQFGTKKLYLVIKPILKGKQLFTPYRPCKSYDKNGTKGRYRLNNKKLCKRCEIKENLRKASGDLILLETPSWPIRSWNSLERSSTAALAIERFKYYCAMLQSSPELLNNYNGVLVTEYIVTCLNKVISNKPLSEKE